MIEGDAIYAEYIGLDYSIALKLHLYHYVVRDMIKWSIAHNYRWFRSSPYTIQSCICGICWIRLTFM